MGDVPALGAFCYKDSLLIDQMRTTAAKQKKRIAELESMLATMNEAAEESAKWHKDQNDEIKRLREAYHELYAEANSWLTSDQPDRIQLLDAMHSKALEDGDE